LPLILFVCSGNTCRSVMAEALLRHHWQLQGGNPTLKIGSAGLAANPGERAAAYVQKLLEERGIHTDVHSATLLDSALVEKAGLILAMTARHRETLLARFPEASGKVNLLKEYAGVAGESLDIDDPFGGSLEKYRRIMDEIQESVMKTMDKLKD